MIDWSKLYDEFLYDCYVANQRLTDEEWKYYGREEHHIEIPNRDGGLLTPLNSQYLTTYQHWIAGVLQSEVLGKLCFAFVPVGVLPDWLETLRIKWQRTQVPPPPMTSELARQLADARTTEQRSQMGKRAAETRKRNGNNTQFLTPEKYTAMVTKCSTSAHKIHAARSPEERTAIARKGHETRRLKRLSKGE